MDKSTELPIYRLSLIVFFHIYIPVLFRLSDRIVDLSASALEYILIGIIIHNKKESMQKCSPTIVDNIETKSLLEIKNILPIIINKIIKENSRILNCSHILIMLFRNISK